MVSLNNILYNSRYLPLDIISLIPSGSKGVPFYFPNSSRQLNLVDFLNISEHVLVYWSVT